MTVAPAAVAARPLRSRGIDALRGIAVLCMVVDHVALFAGVTELRWTVGRLAMPLFFILAGHLARRVSWRVAWLALVGVCLPALAPWVDSPNVLVILALGMVLLALARSLRVSPFVGVVVVLAAAANHVLPDQVGTSYDAGALLALMCVGAVIPRESLERHVRRLPAGVLEALAAAGRYPLSLYVGHVLLLTLLFT